MIDLSCINVDSTLADLPYHLFQVSLDTKVSEVAKRFEQDLQVPAVVIVDREGLIINMLSRRKFLERMSKPYGLELFTNQPIRRIIPFINTRPLRLSASTKVDAAARIVLSRTDNILCEPIIAIAQDGLRVVDCHTIFLAQSKILSLVNAKLEDTLVALEQSQDELKTINIQLTEEIKERQRVEEQLSYNALHDALTGLANRGLFMNRLEQSFRHYQRSKDRLFGVMFIDLDRFKAVNDNLGHGVGDALLVQVSDRLQLSLRNVDTVARLGGDEFAVVLEEITELSQAEICALRIQTNLSEPFHIDGHRVSVGASIGIAMITSHYKNSEELLRDADMAMYQAKRQGKSSYHIFPWINAPNIQPKSQKNLVPAE
ncbi:diguanylate cyclase (GGDEF) domain-containing protein [Synechococcus sp. PCC 7502]|uniref:GGDEF domain-containing protein n=1 Tax=Synechococcus sp. PCC 7502 TaxID=1173263 RepID=UPI00029FA831|nr:GGDEF domain-containing protein [Synechococcus sp. PCC 7502]AFY72494.1 diguanylate cyclase (GGDEF) domain-containing protein [Synechococcus sp. PCC 7502]